MSPKYLFIFVAFLFVQTNGQITTNIISNVISQILKLFETILGKTTESSGLISGILNSVLGTILNIGNDTLGTCIPNAINNIVVVVRNDVANTRCLNGILGITDQTQKALTNVTSTNSGNSILGGIVNNILTATGIQSILDNLIGAINKVSNQTITSVTGGLNDILKRIGEITGINLLGNSSTTPTGTNINILNPLTVITDLIQSAIKIPSTIINNILNTLRGLSSTQCTGAQCMSIARILINLITGIIPALLNLPICLIQQVLSIISGVTNTILKLVSCLVGSTV